MAKNKGRQFDDATDDDYQQYVAQHDSHFVASPEHEKPKPVREISENEARRRDLRRRYKAVFGFKPCEKDMDTLQQLVEDAERR